MQMVIKNRETLTGSTTVFSSPFDVSGYSTLTGSLIVYAMSGSGVALDVSLQTSDDLETWTSLATSFPAVSGTGASLQAWLASTEKYGRYVRAEMTLAGTNPLANFSLFINTFESS